MTTRQRQAMACQGLAMLDQITAICMGDPGPDALEYVRARIVEMVNASSAPELALMVIGWQCRLEQLTKVGVDDDDGAMVSADDAG